MKVEDTLGCGRGCAHRFGSQNGLTTDTSGRSLHSISDLLLNAVVVVVVVGGVAAECCQKNLANVTVRDLASTVPT